MTKEKEKEIEFLKGLLTSYNIKESIKNRIKELENGKRKRN